MFRAAATAVALALGLASCAGEADKAAAPLPGALEALGLHGLSWERAQTRGADVVLSGARAEFEGLGHVRAAEIVVAGFRAEPEGWSAASVRAERVAGAMSAERVVVVCDGSKVGRRTLARMAGLDQVAVLVTDEQAPAGELALIRAAGVEVFIV